MGFEKKNSNQTCKGRVHKDLPNDWKHIWTFHRKNKMEEDNFTYFMFLLITHC